jgi:hypothetical protein
MFMHTQQELVLASSWVLEKSWGLILDLFLKNGRPFGFGFMEYLKKLKP